MTERLSPGQDELTITRTGLADRCDVVLLASQGSVTYASGFAVPDPAGVVAAVAHGPAFAVIPINGGTSSLAIPEGQVADAREQTWLGQTLGFATFDSFAPSDPTATYLAALREGLGEAGLRDGLTLGIEGGAVPASAARSITEWFPGARVRDVADRVAEVRRRKTTREVGLIRNAVHAADAGQRALAAAVGDPDANEFTLYAQVREAMWDAAGADVPVVGELVSGPRTAVVRYPGGPVRRTVSPGDAVLMDISVRVAGYWADCTNTHIQGGRSSAEARHHAAAAQDAFIAAVQELRPGRQARDAWRAAAAAYRSYGLEVPHYLGHQIGVTVNERPRLVPYDEDEIQPSMVFAVEPGSYQGPDGTFGARFEKVVLVTETGPRVLSEFDWGIDPAAGDD